MRPILATALVLLAAPVLAQSGNQSGSLPGAPVKARIPAGTYKVDPNHTQVTWKVNHMGFSMLEGQFGASSGQIAIDPAKPNETKVDVTFKTDELSTSSARFTEHLKSKDFFDVANHPNARFMSTNVRANGDKATINGNLTINGVTKPVTLQADFVGAGANPMSKKLNFGFRATGSINRSDFNLGMAVPVVSDKVDLAINAAFAAE